MSATDNPRARMLAGEALTGTFVQSRDPGQCEFLGRLGFDLLCVEGEQNRREVSGWVAVCHRAADRAPCADLGIGEDRKGVREGRDAVDKAPGPVDEGGSPIAGDETLAA